MVTLVLGLFVIIITSSHLLPNMKLSTGHLTDDMSLVLTAVLGDVDDILIFPFNRRGKWSS